MAGTFNPLQERVPIVNKDGTPTPYFMRQLQALVGGGVSPGSYSSPGITVDVNGKITEIHNTGGLVLITSIDVAIAQPSLTFAGIPNQYSGLVISIHGRGDTAATTATARLNFNDDTGGNYYSDSVNRLGSVQVAAGAYAECGIFPAATTTAGRAGTSEIILPDFQSGGLHKEFSFSNFFINGATPTAAYGGGHWESLLSITDIDITLSAGNWDVGTHASLYGRG